MPNQPPFDEFMQFINQFIQKSMQETPAMQEPRGILLRSPMGEIFIELDGQDVSISINDIQVVRLDCDLQKEEIVIKAYDYHTPTNKHEYEQLVDLKPDIYGNETQHLNQFIQHLQEGQQFVTLERELNSNQDACILVKVLDETISTKAFQVWYIPNHGSAHHAMYMVAQPISYAPSLASGINIFNQACQKLHGSD